MKSSDKKVERFLGENVGGAARFDPSPLFEKLIEEGTIDRSAPRIDGLLKARLWMSERCRISATRAGLVAAAVLLIFVCATAVLTPVDSAVARWVGQLIRIGEPGGQPSLHAHSGQRGGPFLPNDTEPVVLGVWRAQKGGRTELVGWRSGNQLCLSADEPEQAANGWFCVEDSATPPPVQAASLQAVLPRDDARATTVNVIGRVDERVVEVRVLPRGRGGPSELRSVWPLQITPDLAQRLESKAQAFGVFLAEINADDEAVLIEGLDSGGRTVGSTLLPIASQTKQTKGRGGR